MNTLVNSAPSAGYVSFGNASQSLLTPVERLLDRIGNACILIAILGVPLTMAGMRENGTLIFVICSLVLGVTWALKQALHPQAGAGFCGAEAIVLASILLVIFQLTPLPLGILRTIAPFSSNYLTLWETDAGRQLGISQWSMISLTPSATRSALVLLIAYSIFFLTLMQRIRTKADIDSLIKLIALAGVTMSLIGVGQLFFGNGKFLWFIEHPFRDANWPAKGTFTNQNHFAHFLALTIGPLIWVSQNIQATAIRPKFWTARNDRSEFGSIAVNTLIGIVGLSAVLSLSRGGIIAFALALGVSATAYRKRLKALFKVLAFSGAFVVLAVLSFGTEGLQAKLNSVTSAGSLSNLSTGRFALWESLLLAIPNFWMTGSGVGSHAEIYPTWLSQQFGVRFSHAESGYMQVMLELGLPGLVLLLTGIALIGFWAVCAWRANHDEDRRRVTILAAGIVASVLHSFIDFVWYIPACMILTLVIAACLCRCYQLSGSDKPGDTRVHNRRWPAGMAWAFLILFMPVCQLSASVTLRNAQTESDWLQYRDSDKPVDERIQHLENCVSTDPADFQSMARLSGLYFERFETKTLDSPNKMTALEIRSTVRSAEFESTKAIAEWMVRAFGEEAKDLYKSIYMARRALKGMPMRTEPYIVLSQLGFLIGVSDEGSTILLDQALRLRPHSPEVLLRAGLSCSERGELDLACEFLSKACKLDYRLRPTVVNQLAPYMSAEEFINRMAPGPDGLWLLFRFHQNKKRTNDEAFVAAWFCNNFESLRLDQNEADFYFWPRAAELFTANSDAKNALFCLEQGVQRNPNDYALRINLAVSFWKAGRIEESRRQFDWCKLRNPDHKQLLTAIEELKADGGAL